MPSKTAITIEQRRALRKWAHRQHPKPTQKECIEWFRNKFDHQISQSTVSESLSKRFDKLDTDNTLQGSRDRVGNWPEVEEILVAWQKRIESNNFTTSGDILKEKAREIWDRLPHRPDDSRPAFSNGWLRNFKERFHIKEITRHGEAASFPAYAEVEMAALRTIAGEYKDEDIYNMDETGLYWKMMPSRGLATQSMSGIKKDRARVSLVFCTNASGTDRFPVWIIGKAKTPVALRNISVPTMGAQWRWNKKAWMNTTIMIEWLNSFFRYIGQSRKILLTMDNFSAHAAALELCVPPSNIRMCWLPANSTTRFQPLDQGIIQAFKSIYKRQWLHYMLDHFTINENPLDSMNIRYAIRWIVRAWNSQLTNTTIYNCFRKSTLLSVSIALPTPLEPSDINDLYEQVIQANNIHDQMTISNFLNPEDEDIYGETGMDQSSEDILQELLDEHLSMPETQHDDDEEAEVEQPVITLQTAQQALQVLIGFSEGQSALESQHLRNLERLQGIFEVLDLNSKVQRTLDGWIT